MKGDRQFKKYNEELIIRGAYGELNFFEKRKLKKMLHDAPELVEVYNEYKKSADTIKHDNSESLSNDFENKLYRKTGIENKTGSTLFEDFLFVLVNKPIKFSAAFSVILVIVLTSIFTDLRLQEREYTDSEILAANKEASEVLLLVSKVFNETREEFAEGVLKSRVARPLQKGIGIVNTILTNGDKNEKSNL
ncbi:MAG: hypothetical protein SCALA702_21050 [Melioribacteraceae bacterium]|nr:MAG: hypothetical protein SCALA702_21050 [Melioribacteraceae bacterium]